MDVNTITVADFKAQFTRDFPYLPVYDPARIYNLGAEVYYPADELFYKSKANGPAGVSPPLDTKWELIEDSTENYVLDSDITRAFEEAKMLFNIRFFGTDDQQKLGFLYLTAMYLVNDLRAAATGAGSGSSPFALTSRRVGNVSETYGIPKAYLDSPQWAMYIQSPYGLKYLSFIWPQMVGNIGSVCGGTNP